MLLKEMRMLEHSGSQQSELRLSVSSLGAGGQLVWKVQEGMIMMCHYCPAGLHLAASYLAHTV
jgi:hypothetical protein